MTAAPLPLTCTPNAEHAGEFDLRVGDHTAISLTREEALWAFASYLFGELPPWFRTDAQLAEWRARYGPKDEAAPALLGQVAGASVAVDRAKDGVS